MNPLHLIKPYIIENRTRIVIGLISLIIVDFLQLIIPRIIKTAVDELTLYQASWEGLVRQALAILVVGVLIGGFRPAQPPLSAPADPVRPVFRYGRHG